MRNLFKVLLNGLFINNFEYISRIILVFPSLNLNKYMPAGKDNYLNLFK